MRWKWVFALAALSPLRFTGAELIAQDMTVLSGRITSEFGTPLAANVGIEEMSLSVVANTEGRYSIIVPAGRVRGQSVRLRVRAIGYSPASSIVAITPGSQTRDFVLRKDVNRLDEIVITGTVTATTQKKLGYSLAKLDESDMRVPSPNALSQLQGKVPGALIVQPSGRPGASPAIVLRGPKSLNAAGRQQGPLLIVDGAILNAGTQDINPHDIESIEVIKGAAASTLYGSRAGAGVISITTKSGSRSPEGTRLTLRSEYGVNDVQNEYAYATRHNLMMDERNERFCIRVTGQPRCSRTVDLEEETRRVNSAPTSDALPPHAFERDYGIGAPGIPELKGLFQVNRWPKTYNPIAQIITSGRLRSNVVDVTSRTGATAYFASLSDFAQEGAIRFLQGYRRNTGRANVDHKVGEHWSIALHSSYARANHFPATFGAGNITSENFLSATRVPASVDLLRRDNLGRLYIRSNPLAQGVGNVNPLYVAENQQGQLDDDRLIASLALHYTPLPWLTFDATGSTDRLRTAELGFRDREFRTTAPFGSFGGGTRGFIFETATADLSQNLMLSARAEEDLGADWRGTVTARYSHEQQDTRLSDGYGEQLAVTGVHSLRNATSNIQVFSSAASVRAIGAIAGGRLEYKERYIFDGLARLDGSSLFGADERWHPYYRSSFAWRLSDEPFWPLPRVANEGKLRASVGTAGGRPRFESQYEVFSVGTGGQVTPTATLGNRSLKPEHTLETEYGFDGEFFSKYGISLTYARDITTNQILRIPVPASSGYPGQWQNAGTLDGKTWELSLRIPILTARNLAWSSQLAWDRNRTYIAALNQPPFYSDVVNLAPTIGIRFYYAPGERYGTIHGRKYVTRCSELPAPFDAQCGPGREWQANDEGYIVWIGQGHTWREGVALNLWQASRPGCVRNGTPLPANGADECQRRGGTVNAPWGPQTTHWGMPTILRDSTATPAIVPLGNVMPDYRVTMSHSIQWRRLNVYGLLDISRGNRVFNMERHWSFLDFMVREQDQDGKTPETAKPIGYWWRGSAPLSSLGVGGFYGDLVASNRTLEDGSYTKLRELSVAYELPRLSVISGQWSVSLTGRNLYTWTRFSGWDPEAGLAGGLPNSAALATAGMFQYPPTRTFTIALQGRL